MRHGKIKDFATSFLKMTWHVLDVGSIWIKEFASALNSFTPTVSWAPVMRAYGFLERWEREEELADPALRIRRFPGSAEFVGVA